MTDNRKTTMTDAGDATIPSLPPLYRSLVALDRHRHDSTVIVPHESYGFAAETILVPVTADEAALAQADYPIVFMATTKPMPVVLTGLPGQKNRFVDANGRWKAGSYIPAYLRRYPFLLVRNPRNAESLALCFDPSAECISERPGEGNLFDKGEPSQTTQAAIRFCKDFEIVARRTEALMTELSALDLLVDGQIRLGRPEGEPVGVQGFRVVSEARLRALSDTDLGNLLRSGALGFIYAHLFSLRHLQQMVATGAPAANERTKPSLRGGDGYRESGAETRHRDRADASL
ncbi:SapC family protein [Ciceribacter sp. RN22]|uniref:SapC family protein n=1 Tax=Ciceribacter sp. RN22 TaxID=2954932 RepID=UPI002093FD3C|nr:SapC family protein [Ciceribacter sp. RN22]MCO6181007.1 SapC family protein [Ciceribacter sp. RN22]